MTEDEMKGSNKRCDSQGSNVKRRVNKYNNKKLQEYKKRKMESEENED